LREWRGWGNPPRRSLLGLGVLRVQAAPGRQRNYSLVCADSG